MKKNSQLIFSCLCTVYVLFITSFDAQAQWKNYILSQKQLSNMSQSIQNYEFFDDLGRSRVKATNGICENGKYVYTLDEYLGEQMTVKKWLPIVGSCAIEYLSLDDFSQRSLAQYVDNNAFENFEYDALGRLRKHYNAGTEWKLHLSNVSYVTNSSNDVKKFSAYSSGKYTAFPSKETSLISSGYYNEGTLIGIRNSNEDGVMVTVYKDVYGKLILERRGERNDTYYVYDEWDRLSFVLTPEYQYNEDIDRFAYRYEYDLIGNVTKKGMPGCANIEYVYDDFRRCFLMQDGELKKNKRYRFYLYDKVGRVVVQGLCDNVPNPIESTVYYSCGSCGTKYSDYLTLEGKNTELGITALEVVNYYDDYRFFNGSKKGAVVFQDFERPDSSYSKGMLTGSVVYTSDGRKIGTVYSYDIQGNLIEVQEKGLDGHIVKTENTYTYTNKLASSKTTISYPKGEDIEYTIRNSYNPNNDFLKEATYQAKIGNKSTGDCKMSYTYDQLGRIESINRPVSNGKGNVSYNYDIHGWLTNINNNSFSEQLHYNDGAGDPLYSGNISSMTWKNGSSLDRGYKYTYDEMGRLVNSEYGEKNFSRSIGNYDERVSYDENGNITSLFRNSVLSDGSCRTVDNLTMYYDGNQLCSVEEKASPVLNSSFLDVKKSSDDFQYNSSGSLVYDGTRGITNIRYDNNNNPIRIQFDNGNVTKYVYSVTGQKLRTIHYTAPKNIHVEMGCDYEDIERNCLTKDSVDYLLGGNVIYENNQFSKILFDGGYIDSYTEMESLPVRPIREFAATDGDYQTQLEGYFQASKTKTLGFKFYNKDHLGNNREVIDQEGYVCQRNDYYPFGTPYFSRYVTINSVDQPFKYNGKEFDMMHGLNTYDYGARQYNPILPMWDRVDPLAEKYCNVSPYAYCANNPVKYVDPDGKKIVFVNGYLAFGSPKGGSTYWNGMNSSFLKGAQSTFDDYSTPHFTNYEFKYLMSASKVRESLGYQYARNNYEELTKGMQQGVDAFNFVSHSMGGAFSEGMMKFLSEQGWLIENAVFLNAWEPTKITNKVEEIRIDATCTNDPVQMLSIPLFGEPDIPNSDKRIRIKSKESLPYIHRDLIDGNENIWTELKDKK